jgi:TolB-like protein/tetratricopeptide (TPR) repeat protein
MTRNLRREIYEFGPYRLDQIERRLYLRDEPIALPAKTFDILLMLVESGGQVVTKEQIFGEIWSNQYVEENNLTVRISQLRRALAESPECRFIETVYGSGYRFVARIGGSDRLHPNTGGTADTLAVLPLSCNSSAPLPDYFCDGLTEGLIDSLSQESSIKVVSRSSIFRYKGMDLDPVEVGRELRVRAVVFGYVTQTGNKVGFSVELISVDDGRRLWHGTFQRSRSKLHDLQTEIARQISGAFRFSPGESTTKPVAQSGTANVEAYHLYLKGRYFWNRRSASDLFKAIKYFKSALTKDPRYALAYSSLADAYLAAATYGLEAPASTVPRARIAASKALELDPQLAEAHISLGRIKTNFDWDWSGAEDEYRKAIELRPNHPDAHHYYSMLLARLGLLDVAIGEIRKAFETDPLSINVQLALVRILYFAGEFDSALSHANDLLEIHPNFGIANGLIGMIYLEQERYKDALREIKKLVAYSEADRSELASSRKAAFPSQPDTEALGVLGYAYGLGDNRRMAGRVLNRLLREMKKRYVEPHAVALVNIGLGKYDEAFEWLEKAFTERTSSLTYLRVWPLFRRLKGEERYQILLDRLNLA